MKVTVRIHGTWEPGEELVIDSEPGPDGVHDAFTPEYEASGRNPADWPEPRVVEMDLPEPEFPED